MRPSLMPMSALKGGVRVPSTMVPSLMTLSNSAIEPSADFVCLPRQSAIGRRFVKRRRRPTDPQQPRRHTDLRRPRRGLNRLGTRHQVAPYCVGIGAEDILRIGGNFIPGVLQHLVVKLIPGPLSAP